MKEQINGEKNEEKKHQMLKSNKKDDDDDDNVCNCETGAKTRNYGAKKRARVILSILFRIAWKEYG